MTVRTLLWMPLAVLAGLPTSAATQETAITLSGDPQVLVIHTALPGYSPDPVWDESTVYSLSVTETSDLLVHVDAPLPAGVTLLIRMEPPPGATQSGAVALSQAPQAVIRSVPPGTYTGLGISYELQASTAAGVIPLSSRQITFTITTGR